MNKQRDFAPLKPHIKKKVEGNLLGFQPFTQILQ
jgi:hypothetical protein